MIDLSSYLPLIRVEKRHEIDHIWCQARKSWFILTPEEVVRQTVISQLLELEYSIRHITAEKQIKVHGQLRRYDIAVADKHGEIFILVECKEPGVVIREKAMDQIANYNLEMHSKYLWITNGHLNFIYMIDHDLGKAIPVDVLPLSTDS